MAYNGKRLHKSESDKKLCGVCGGIAEYFDIDPTLVRLAWIIFCLAGGSGVLGYIIAALVMPEDPQPSILRGAKKKRRPVTGRRFCVTVLRAAGDKAAVRHTPSCGY